MNPQCPIYVISKGRWESRLTIKALEKCGIPYHIVVEPQEYGEYAAVIPSENIFVLAFSNLGQGSIPARNWVWEHALSSGAKWHWILDDNIRDFMRLNRNLRVPVIDGTIFKVAEDFIERYENVAEAGFNYYMFAPRRQHCYPYTLNTRIYSCILIRNSIPYRWRGCYNEDTDLSLRILKDGWCTVLFNAFLARKTPTMRMKGGNTEQLYKGRGRLAMAESLRRQHPDVTKIKWKWGRWQHVVDYSGFRQQLIRRRDIVVPPGTNDFSMELEYQEGENWRQLAEGEIEKLALPERFLKLNLKEPED